ncbi:hypothetical protein HPB52_023111 [Rhipicephalus sanguineus]|uniref:Uncharacterized protein n=1 Tax=Rhipicephalus sanguineus TaxID=34632 RepID=A0A9D4SP97_RHISA|nr:hypothetical protein HPB52_023111 [Rhipicephalus sanguineus]
MPGECNFQSAWLSSDDYKRWIAPDASDPHRAKYTLCKKTFDIASMGESGRAESVASARTALETPVMRESARLFPNIEEQERAGKEIAASNNKHATEENHERASAGKAERTSRSQFRARTRTNAQQQQVCGKKKARAVSKFQSFSPLSERGSTQAASADLSGLSDHHGPEGIAETASRAEKRALAKQAACRANYKRFMKEVYPEIIKTKSPWPWSGISTTPDSPKSSQRSHAPGKRPLSETAETRLGRPSARPEKAPVGKRSYWYVPKALKDYKTDEKPREREGYKYRTPDPSSVDDSPIGTVKQPTYNFWQNSGRSWKRSTRPATELLMESDGVEAAVNSLKAAAAKGAETSSPKAPSPRVFKLLEWHGEEPPMPPKGESAFFG